MAQFEGPQKEVDAIRMKATGSIAFIVEGVASESQVHVWSLKHRNGSSRGAPVRYRPD
jgi:hypothetical protein